MTTQYVLSSILVLSLHARDLADARISDVQIAVDELLVDDDYMESDKTSALIVRDVIRKLLSIKNDREAGLIHGD